MYIGISSTEYPYIRGARYEQHRFDGEIVLDVIGSRQLREGQVTRLFVQRQIVLEGTFVRQFLAEPYKSLRYKGDTGFADAGVKNGTFTFSACRSGGTSCKSEAPSGRRRLALIRIVVVTDGIAIICDFQGGDAKYYFDHGQSPAIRCHRSHNSAQSPNLTGITLHSIQKRPLLSWIFTYNVQIKLTELTTESRGERL